MRYDADATGNIFVNLWQQQWIVRATQDDGVNVGVEAHQLVDALFYEVVGARGVSLVVFHQWHPERTGHTTHGDVGIQLLDLQIITLTLYRSFGGKDSHMARCRKTSYHLCRRPYHSQHSPVRVNLRQVYLLYRPEGLG